MPNQVFSYGGAGNIDAKLQQYAMDSRCSPKHVHPTHDLDQIASLLRDTGPSRPAMTNLPRPIPTESLTVPSDYRFWFDNDES